MCRFLLCRKNRILKRIFVCPSAFSHVKWLFHHVTGKTSEVSVVYGKLLVSWVGGTPSNSKSYDIIEWETNVERQFTTYWPGLCSRLENSQYVPDIVLERERKLRVRVVNNLPPELRKQPSSLVLATRGIFFFCSERFCVQSAEHLPRLRPCSGLEGQDSQVVNDREESMGWYVKALRTVPGSKNESLFCAALSSNFMQ